MTNVKNKSEIYKCNVCGNIVEVIHIGGGELVCCKQPMEIMKTKTYKDEEKEKHIPVVEANGKGILVRVGSTPHPMEENHYIEWIEIIADGISYRKFLKPEIAPEANFAIVPGEIIAKAYCNIHGLWQS